MCSAIIVDLIGSDQVTIPASSLALANADYTWRRDAICRDTDPDLFFPVGTTGYALVQIDRAKQVCGECPVHVECLEYALETNQDSGSGAAPAKRSGAPFAAVSPAASASSSDLHTSPTELTPQRAVRRAERGQTGTVRSTTVPVPRG
jgi:hypothetical protein